MLHLEALEYRRLVELLTCTEFLNDTSLLKLSLELLQGALDVLAVLDLYYVHVVVWSYFVIT